jgi:chemotaxis signal transduction protein
MRLPVFSDVDVFPCKQAIAKLKNLGFVCEFKEKLVGLIIDEVLGVVE